MFSAANSCYYNENSKNGKNHLDLPQQIPATQAKARIQKPEAGENLVQISGVCGEGGWFWKKLVAI